MLYFAQLAVSLNVNKNDKIINHKTTGSELKFKKKFEKDLNILQFWKLSYILSSSFCKMAAAAGDDTGEFYNFSYIGNPIYPAEILFIKNEFLNTILRDDEVILSTF